MNSKVSVIVPVYNLEECIEYCIDSILNQTYSNLEIILVNDGSTDNSLKKCFELAKKDNRINIIDKPNGGVSSARNAGIEKASGEFITFVDGDDVLAPQMIEILLQQFDKENIKLSTCCAARISAYDYAFDDLAVFKECSTQKCLEWLLLEKVEMSVWGKIYIKSEIGDIRFFEGKKINEDKYFLFQYLNSVKGNVAYTSEQLYGYYNRQKSVTNELFSDKYLDAVYFSNRIVEVCNKKDEYTQNLAEYNLMASRFMVLKKIIRTKTYIKNKVIFNKIKKDILLAGLPNRLKIRRIKKYEFYVLKISSLLYYLMVVVIDKTKHK